MAGQPIGITMNISTPQMYIEHLEVSFLLCKHPHCCTFSNFISFSQSLEVKKKKKEAETVSIASPALHFSPFYLGCALAIQTFYEFQVKEFSKESKRIKFASIRTLAAWFIILQNKNAGVKLVEKVRECIGNMRTPCDKFFRWIELSW